MRHGIWRLSIREEFSASHSLLHYEGKCERLHGHNFGVEVEVQGSNLNEKTGLLMDFKDLRKETKGVLEALDHSHLNDCEAFAGKSPSSEAIALYIFTELDARVKPYHVKLTRVTVSEKAGQSASYVEES